MIRTQSHSKIFWGGFHTYIRLGIICAEVSVMQKQNEHYLYALLNWAEEVEQKVNQSSFSLDRNGWSIKMNEWKGEIEDLIHLGVDPSGDKLNEIKSSGEQLVLEVVIDRGRQESHIGVGEHQLPPLPYAYDALEPYISAEIMRLHHDIHHKGYVEGLNKAEKMIAKWSETNNNSMLRHWMREQSFNGSGHFLHSIFWKIMSPSGGGNPTGVLQKQIIKDFTGVDHFKKLFTHAAQSVQGSGWAMLVWEIPSGRLKIQTVEKHNMYALWDVIPLLVLDVWEHAYYLQYETDKNKYIENWWNIVNWEHVSERFQKVKDL
jgi:superoxide dismutase, Fe-Mn family